MTEESKKRPFRPVADSDYYAQLLSKFAPEATFISVEPLSGGVSSATYLLCFRSPLGGDERVVLRRPGSSSEITNGEFAARREYELLVNLCALGLAVPRPRFFLSPDTLVLDYVAGSTRMPPDAAALYAQALATIHATSTKTLGELPLRIDPVLELPKWLGDLPFAARTVAGRTEYRSQRRCLLHGDFWPGNILWRNDRLVAIIDWEDAAIGEPLSDLACARLELAFAAGNAMAFEFTNIYLEITGLNAEALPIWDLYVASAALNFMDQWGLAVEELAQRKSVTRVWQERALEELGLQS